MEKIFNNKNELYLELALFINEDLYKEKIILYDNYNDVKKQLLKKIYHFHKRDDNP